VAGLSEAVKVAALRDPEFFNYLETHGRSLAAGDAAVMAKVVERAAELHLAHICGNGDPFELGSARPLDFGHWAAHKLEAMTHHRLRHGEAVAIGIALDVTYAAAMQFIDAVSSERVLRLLETLGLRLCDEAMAQREADGRLTLLHGLREFREHLGGELHVTMLRGIGQGFEVNEMDETVVAEAVETLSARRRTSSRVPAAVAAAR
jgi:3-dehydroquinate synthase